MHCQHLRQTITSLRFACGIDDLAGEEVELPRAGEQQELAKVVERLDKASAAYGMEITVEKTQLVTTPVASTQRSN